MTDPGPASPPQSEQPLERPIETEAQDRFGRSGFVRRLATALIAREGQKARGVVVGIVGPWGSGKSSVLNLLAADLAGKEPRPVVVRFEPWLVSGREDLILALITEMHAALARAPGLKEKAGKFLDTASPYVSALGRLGNSYMPGLGEALNRVLDAIKQRLRGPSGLLELKAAVGRALQEVPAPVIVLIDELDRLREEEVRTVAQLVRAVADFPHVSYVLAYDQRRVEEALGGDLPGDAAERRERGRAYLEKLVHIPIPLPIALSGETRDLLLGEVQAVLSENGIGAEALSGQRAERLLSLLAEEVLEAPREVLRATGAFRVLAGMVGEEVDMLDLLAFTVLQTKFPDLYAAIRDTPDSFAPDLGTMRGASVWMALREEKDPEKRLTKRFPGIELSDAARALVQFLLPDEAESGTDAEAGGNTLRHRRALVTALRLGLPPGAVSRSETERLFRAPEEKASEILRRSLAEDKLADLLDRASEVYPLMAAPSDAFWPAAAKLFRRSKSRWVPRYAHLRDLIEPVATLATRRLRRSPTEASRFVAVADALRDAKDVSVLPFWYQWHALGFGMFGLPLRENRAATAFLDREGLEARLAEQADWVHSAFCDGDLFFELYHSLVLHQLAYIGRWDDACRRRLESLLEQPEGADQLALLLFGGNYTTDREQIEHLIDEGTFTTRITERLEQAEAASAHPSLLSALRKGVGRIE